MNRVVGEIEYTEEEYTANMKSLFEALKHENPLLEWEDFKLRHEINE